MPPISKSELEKLYQEGSDRSVGEQLGVSASAVRKWRSTYGIPGHPGGRRRNYSYSDQDLVVAVRDSVSLAGVMRRVGLTPNGGSYQTVHQHIKRLGLSVAHFTGQAHTAGEKGCTTRLPSGVLLAANNSHSRRTVRRRIIRENLLKYECAECGIFEWRGEPLSLHLDHINGVNNDHRLENLRFLCPNCHTLTPTWAGKNIGTYSPWAKGKPKVLGQRNTDNYCKCGKEISRKAVNCKSCRPMPSKIDWPSDLELAKRIKSSSKLGVSKELGVSETAVRKRIKRRPGLASFLAE